MQGSYAARKCQFLLEILFFSSILSKNHQVLMINQLFIIDIDGQIIKGLLHCASKIELEIREF